MTAAGNPLGLRGVEDLAGGRVRFVNREDGAALRRLPDFHLGRLGIPAAAVQGYSRETHSHEEGAFPVASDRADVAFGLRSAAAAFGLGFIPPAVTRCDLVMPASAFERAEVRVLADLLQSSALRKKLGALPGCDASRTGTVIAEGV